MKNFLFSVTLFCALLIVATAQAGAQTLLNEINVNPPGTDNPCEYVEIRGTPGATLSNLYFVSFEGDGVPSGTADMVVSLGSQVIGSNGTLTIVSPTACTGRTLPAGTTQVTDAQLDNAGGGIENGTVTNMLISSTAAIVEGTDYDTNNDGTLEALPSGATIVDSVGWTDGGAGDIVYGSVILSQGAGTPQAATRFANSTGANDPRAWYNGNLDSAPGSSSTVYDATSASTNFPTGGALTPGAPNVGNLVLRNGYLDFNGDGRTDYVVTRLINNQLTWFIAHSGLAEARAFQWGTTGDIPMPDDFDGDGRDDIAVWRPTGYGDPGRSYFFIYQSGSNTIRADQFGSSGDNPRVVGDYDGDAKADPAVFRAGTNNGPSYFYYRPSSVAGADFVQVQWGAGSDIPAQGDYDGDGKFDFAVYRQNARHYYLLKSSGGTEAIHWGFDIPEPNFVWTLVPGDYDGDKKTDFALFGNYQGSGGNWIILERDGGRQTHRFGDGTATDVLVPGDYNGDGRFEPAIRRQSTSPAVFFSLNQSGNQAIAFPWGLPSDDAVARYRTNQF